MKTNYVGVRLLGSLIVYLYCLMSAYGDTTNITPIRISAPITNTATPSGVIRSTDKDVIFALTSPLEKGWVMRLVGNSEFHTSRRDDFFADVRTGEDKFTFPSIASLPVGDRKFNLSFRIAAVYPRGDIFEPIKEGVGLYLCFWSPFDGSKK